MTAVLTFVVSVAPELRDAVAARVAWEAEREAPWWAAKMAEVRAQRTQRARRRAHAAALAERVRLREAGEFLGTRDAVMRWEVRLYMQEQGWLRQWPAVPPGAAERPGRPPGPAEHRSPVRLAIKLRQDLADQVRAAAYWVSEERGEGALPLTTGDIIRTAARRAAKGFLPNQ